MEKEKLAYAAAESVKHEGIGSRFILLLFFTLMTGSGWLLGMYMAKETDKPVPKVETKVITVEKNCDNVILLGWTGNTFEQLRVDKGADEIINSLTKYYGLIGVKLQYQFPAEEGGNTKAIIVMSKRNLVLDPVKMEGAR